jgi:LemA protein
VAELQPWLLLAGAALLVFWVLGAHNRLVAHRNAIGNAWAQVEQTVQRRAVAVQALLGALREALADEAATLGAVQAALERLQPAADALRARPAQADRAAAFAAAEAAFGAALARLVALVEHRPTLRDDDGVSRPLAQLQEAQARLPLARALYNDAAQAFNEAAHQFPTRLVAHLFGFAPAGSL